MLELVAILLTKLEYEVDNFGRRIRNLDGVGLDMNYLEALLLDCELQINHEQGATLSDDVVLVTNILERVFESSTRQTVDAVDNRLQSVRKPVKICILIDFNT